MWLTMWPTWDHVIIGLLLIREPVHLALSKRTNTHAGSSNKPKKFANCGRASWILPKGLIFLIKGILNKTKVVQPNHWVSNSINFIEASKIDGFHQLWKNEHQMHFLRSNKCVYTCQMSRVCELRIAFGRVATNSTCDSQHTHQLCKILVNER